MTATIRVKRSDGSTEDISLGQGTHVVGREAATITLGEPEASAIHARLEVGPQRVVLTDAGSRNGTYDAMGRRITEPLALQIDQPVRIGRATLSLVYFVPQSGGTVMLGASASAPPPAAPPVYAVAPVASPVSMDAPGPMHGPPPSPPYVGHAGMSRSASGKSSAALWVGLLVAAFGVIMLVAWAVDRGRPSASNFEAVIDAAFEESGVKCVRPWRNDVSLPKNVSMVPALVGDVIATGHMSLQSIPTFGFSGGGYVLDVTEKGREEGVWDGQRGICFGTPHVVEVVRWTEPAQGGDQTVDVTIKWQYRDLRRWVDPQRFRGLPGFTAPGEATIEVHKTSDGWQLTDRGKVVASETVGDLTKHSFQ